MKKLLSVLAVLFVMGTTSVFALGIGAQGSAGLGVGSSYGGALTFKLDNAPWVFAVDAWSSSNYLAVGATADMWLANPKINSVFGYFYGWGLAGSVGLGDPLALTAGARILGGINLKIVDDFIEIYIQGAWQPQVEILPNLNPVIFHFPISGGIRFWL